MNSVKATGRLPKRGSSFSQLSSQLYELAGATAIGCESGQMPSSAVCKGKVALLYKDAINHVTTRPGRLLRADYLSARGKWIHLGKLLTVIFIPILGGWVFTLYSIADNVIIKSETVEAQSLMLKAIQLGKLIHTIQKERDMGILFMSKIGPGTKVFLIQEYEKTDKAFADMWSWPVEFANHPEEYFQTKQALINHINNHRNQLNPNSQDVMSEITFYSEIIEFIMQWMIERIRESGFGNTWKSLVVFQKITRCILDAGAERAFGALFFAQGNFPDKDLYDSFYRRLFRFNYNYRSSTFYSDLVNPFLDTSTDQTNSTKAIRELRGEIKISNFSGSYMSGEKAQSYFDNVTYRLDYLSSLQNSIALRIIQRINSTVNGHIQSIVIFSVMASVVVLLCPFIMMFAETLTSSMQKYSKVLVEATDHLDKEKNRTDTLLYQMLPKFVAEKLKRSSKVDSQYFKAATIMFTSVVDFTQLSITFSPIELLDILNKLYTCIDERIEKYDVYKVETINDTYMVVSGIPVPNGDRHASEIAYLALDIVAMVKNDTFMMAGIKAPIHLYLGISTGPVSAGVVGTVMLRYCLFGDTVNTASRMKTYSQPDRIHISKPTFRNLKKTGSFKMTSRGSVTVKGKGEMDTYWLVESTKKYNSPCMSKYQLPGEVEQEEGSAASIMQEQGTSEVKGSYQRGSLTDYM